MDGMKMIRKVIMKVMIPQSAHTRPKIFFAQIINGDFDILNVFCILKNCVPLPGNRKGYGVNNFQLIGCFCCSVKILFVFEKCLHPKKPLSALKGEGWAAFNTKC